MGDDVAISEEEYGSWLVPSHAQTLLEHLSQTGSQDAIIARLLNKSIRAAAEKIVRNGEIENSVSLMLIPPIWWKNSPANPHYSPFWNSGDIVFSLPISMGITRTAYFSCEGIRFERSGIVKMIPPSLIETKLAASVLTAPIPLEKPSAQAIPTTPVSRTTLEAWWALYQTLRPANERSDDDMTAHFKKCLPDKSASRRQLRDLRGSQKRGPKVKPAE